LLAQKHHRRMSFYATDPRAGFKLDKALFGKDDIDVYKLN